MSGLETAIRQALERSDRTNAETRARIYQSARNALEAGLRKQDVHDPGVVSQQRHRLEAIIHAIEQEERSAARSAEPVEQPAYMPQPHEERRPRIVSPEIDEGAHLPPDRGARMSGAPTSDDGLSGVRPDRREFERQPQDEYRVKDEPSLRDSPGRMRAAKVRPPRRKRSKFLSFLMVVATLVAAFGVAAWWVQTSGLLKSPAERDTSVANPPATVQSEDFDGGAGLRTLATESGFTGDWMEIFDPKQPAAAVAGADAAVDTVADDAGARLRIVSSSAEAGGNVSIEIPASALQQMAGKSSTVALSVQADTGKQTEFSVTCDFGPPEACKRYRFPVHDEKTDMYLNIDLDSSFSASKPGHLIINSDVNGMGSPLNIYAIRLQAGR